MPPDPLRHSPGNDERRISVLFGRPADEANETWAETVSPCRSLVAQCFDRIEQRGAAGGIEAEEDTNRR